MTLKFKNEAEFAKWQKSLAEKPRLRVAASMGERVVVDGPRVAVPAAARRRLPTRQVVRRCLARGFLGLMLAGLQGMALCEAALWGMANGGCGPH